MFTYTEKRHLIPHEKIRKALIRVNWIGWYQSEQFNATIDEAR